MMRNVMEHFGWWWQTLFDSDSFGTLLGAGGLVCSDRFASTATLCGNNGQRFSNLFNNYNSMKSYEKIKMRSADFFLLLTFLAANAQINLPNIWYHNVITTDDTRLLSDTPAPAVWTDPYNFKLPDEPANGSAADALPLAASAPDPFYWTEPYYFTADGPVLPAAANSTGRTHVIDDDIMLKEYLGMGRAPFYAALPDNITASYEYSFPSRYYRGYYGEYDYYYADAPEGGYYGDEGDYSYEFNNWDDDRAPNSSMHDANTSYPSSPYYYYYYNGAPLTGLQPADDAIADDGRHSVPAQGVNVDVDDDVTLSFLNTLLDQQEDGAQPAVDLAVAPRPAVDIDGDHSDDYGGYEYLHPANEEAASDEGDSDNDDRPTPTSLVPFLPLYDDAAVVKDLAGQALLVHQPQLRTETKMQTETDAPEEVSEDPRQLPSMDDPLHYYFDDEAVVLSNFVDQAAAQQAQAEEPTQAQTEPQTLGSDEVEQLWPIDDLLHYYDDVDDTATASDDPTPADDDDQNNDDGDKNYDWGYEMQLYGVQITTRCLRSFFTSLSAAIGGTPSTARHTPRHLRGSQPRSHTRSQSRSHTKVNRTIQTPLQLSMTGSSSSSSNTRRRSSSTANDNAAHAALAEDLAEGVTDDGDRDLDHEGHDYLAVQSAVQRAAASFAETNDGRPQAEVSRRKLVDLSGTLWHDMHRQAQSLLSSLVSRYPWPPTAGRQHLRGSA